MEVAPGTPPRFGNPAPSLTKGGRRSLPPGQHLTAANAPAARRWSLSAGHHFSAPAHPSGRPQQQQAVFRATDYPAGAPCPPVLLRGSEGPTGAGGADWPLGLCRPAPVVLVMARKLRPALVFAPLRRSRRLPHTARLAEGRTEPDFEPAEPNDRAVVVVGRCSCRTRPQCARTAAFRRAARMCRSIASRCASRPSPETPCLSVEARRY